MKKLYYIVPLGLAIAGSIVLLLVFYFRPRPIVSGSDSKVIFVWQIVGGHNVHIEGYDEEKVLSYLETCYEQRNLFQRQNKFYRTEDNALMIQLHVNGHLKILHLGRYDYSDDGKWTVKWSVQNANEVLLTLRSILGLEQ